MTDADALDKPRSKWALRYSAVIQAKRKGLLKPVGKTPCERCGAPSQVKHHDDYSRPLDVNYLCKRCHCERHQELGWGIGGRPEVLGLTKALRTMQVGESFLYRYNEGISSIAKKIGIAVSTRKQKTGSYRVWRIA